jgi:hypothetical protein
MFEVGSLTEVPENKKGFATLIVAFSLRPKPPVGRPSWIVSAVHRFNQAEFDKLPPVR